MKLPRRKFLYFATGAAALPVMPRVARAQAYPSRPVRIIDAFAPGGGTDIVARLMGQWLSERLRQPFIIENRQGGNGNIGTQATPETTHILIEHIHDNRRIYTDGRDWPAD